MRTTLDIDEDVLIIAREMAAEEEVSIGEVISRVVRIELDRMRATAEFIRSIAISHHKDGRDS